MLKLFHTLLSCLTIAAIYIVAYIVELKSNICLNETKFVILTKKPSFY